MRLVILAIACAGCAAARSDSHREADPKPVGGTFTAAEYTAHIKALRAQLANKGLGDMVIRIEDPFVVIGDGTDAKLARDAGTVRWAADHLEQDFFAHKPKKLLDIFLFQDAEGYEHGVKTLTGESPTTPYGFYSTSQSGLFMNIATGGGTLVHEIVHPYVEADFPNAPPWLNEGLGSLFEQSDEQDGHIVGRTNWRLAGLQTAIAHGAVPTFRPLTHLGANEFYGDDSGVNYAASRYLLYFLQEHELLHAFYRKFRAARGKDPSGYQTLVEALGDPDMIEFQKRWERYVSALSFP